LFGGVFAKKLLVFAFLLVNAVFLDKLDEVPLREAFKCGFAKVRIGRQEVLRLHAHIGEIAAPATGHKNFFADFVGFFQYKDTPAAIGSGNGTH